MQTKTSHSWKALQPKKKFFFGNPSPLMHSDGNIGIGSKAEYVVFDPSTGEHIQPKETPTYLIVLMGIGAIVSLLFIPWGIVEFINLLLIK